MAHALYTNNATATLAGGISSSATTIVLNSGQGSLFPAPTGGNYFYGTLTDAATGTLIEIVKVTSRTADSMVVARGQQGTVAQAYNANDKFELRVTASGLSELATLDGFTVTGPIVLAANATNSLEAVPKQQLDSTVSAQIAANVVITSTANAQAGINNTELMTPLRTREAFNATGSAPVYACRAWVNFNGIGTVGIRAAGNVSSITDNGTGNYTVNFTNAMPDANYAIIGTAQTTADYPLRFGGLTLGATQTTSAVQVLTSYGASAPNNGAVWDSSNINVAIFR